MNKFEHIFFDFDGTLFDTSEGVFNSFDRVIDFYGLNIDRSIYNTMIGPPLKESFVKTLKLPEDEVPRAIEKYREYYTVHGMFECRIYDGVIELLKKLIAAGKKTYVATSKPEVYANQILERKDMNGLFTFIGGADLDEKLRVTKTDVLRHVIEQNNLKDKIDSCLMIGDRLFDVEGAKEFGMKSCGILWGFGTRQEMIDCGADFICETPDDVFNLLCN